MLSGSSRLAMAENVRTGRKSGKTEREAIQAAFSHARKTTKKLKKVAPTPCPDDNESID